jgi:hypothetical protein
VCKIRDEISKGGLTTLFYLKMNFFANYSAVVQAILARLDLICSKILDGLLKNKQQNKEETK